MLVLFIRLGYPLFEVNMENIKYPLWFACIGFVISMLFICWTVIDMQNQIDSQNDRLECILDILYSNMTEKHAPEAQ